MFTLNFLVASRFLRNCHLGQEIVPLSGECALLVQDHMENVKKNMWCHPKIHNPRACLCSASTHISICFLKLRRTNRSCSFQQKPKAKQFLFHPAVWLWVWDLASKPCSTWVNHIKSPSQCLSLPLGKQTWKQDATSMIFPLPPGPEEKSIHAPSLGHSSWVPVATVGLAPGNQTWQLGQSPTNGGFNGNIVYKWEIYDCFCGLSLCMKLLCIILYD